MSYLYRQRLNVSWHRSFDVCLPRAMPGRWLIVLDAHRLDFVANNALDTNGLMGQRAMLIATLAAPIQWKRHQTKRLSHGRCPFVERWTPMEYLLEGRKWTKLVLKKFLRKSAKYRKTPRKCKTFKISKTWEFRKYFTFQSETLTDDMQISLLSCQEVHRMLNGFSHTNSNVESIDDGLTEVFLHGFFVQCG